MQALLNALLGGLAGGPDPGSNTDAMSAIRDMAFGDAMSPQPGVNDYQTKLAGPGGFAGAMDAPGSNTPAVALPDQQADIAVKGWKPHKPTLLGRLADGLLMSMQGGKPVFSEKAKRENMQEVMEGFTTDPLESIRKLSKMPGMEGKAWELYNQYLDNTRGSDVADRQRVAAQARIEEIGRDRIGSFARSTLNKDGSVNPDAFNKALPTILAYGNSKHIDMSDFPTDGDPQKLNTWIMGSVKVPKQIDQAETADYHDENMDYRRDNLAERTGYHAGTLAQGAANEEGRNTRAATAEGGKNARQDKALAAKPKAYKEGDVKVNPKDKTRAARLEKGKWNYYKRLPNGHWAVDK